jgi:hypothetical protein
MQRKIMTNRRIQTNFYNKDEPQFAIYSDEPFTTVQTDPPEFADKLEFMGLARFRVLSESGELIELDKDKDPYTFVRHFWRHFYGYYASASRPEIIEIE